MCAFTLEIRLSKEIFLLNSRGGRSIHFVCKCAALAMHQTDIAIFSIFIVKTMLVLILGIKSILNIVNVFTL